VAVVEDDRDSVKMYVPRELGGFRFNNATISDGDLVVKARNINDFIKEFRPPPPLSVVACLNTLLHPYQPRIRIGCI